MVSEQPRTIAARSMQAGGPDLPSRHHLPFDRPFDKLTVLGKVEGPMALSRAERRRFLRSLLLAAYCFIRLSRRSLAPYISYLPSDQEYSITC